MRRGGHPPRHQPQDGRGGEGLPRSVEGRVLDRKGVRGVRPHLEDTTFYSTLARRFLALVHEIQNNSINLASDLQRCPLLAPGPHGGEE